MKEKDEVFYDMAFKTFFFIEQKFDALDNKIYNIFAIVMGVVPLLSGLLYFILKQDFINSSTHCLVSSAVVLAGLSLVIYAIAGIFALTLYNPKKRKILSPDVIIEKYWDKENSYILGKTAATISSFIEYNRKIMIDKAKNLTYVNTLIAIGVILTVTCFCLLGVTIILN